MVGQMLVAAAVDNDRPYQRKADPAGTGTDANAMQLSRAGVATGLMGVPNRYMHTQVEVVSLSDLENCAAVLAEMILNITPETDFIPR
jgi:endoglucanase